ncbi:acyltransferase [Metabacillus litoralis]|uniref:Acyltransferase n=1 Tax=Metabacillus litoralis TaxID=152268 RepID=A0A5C6W675_9BACI|nr:acyltransferase [Metabacillus litoralis]TXC92367.1 acyltransferase [Metabacillus litoralis]
MSKLVLKIIKTLMSEGKNRGIYYSFIMFFSHLLGILRGSFYKLVYFKNIKSSIYSLQSQSQIEIFNKNSRVFIGKYVFIRKNTSIRIDYHGELILKDNVFINDNCNINCVNKISIGKNTKIAPNVCINDHDHNYKETSIDHLIRGQVIIGDNVWIGSNVVILRDTVIGDNTVIGAGSVVKGKVPANSIFFNKRDTIIKNIINKDRYISEAN